MTDIIYHEIFLEHDTGDHPECAARLTSIVGHLMRTGVWEAVRVRPPRLASIQDLLTVHTEPYVFEVERAAKEGGRYLDPDTVVSPRSFEVARYAAGGVLSAVDAVMLGEAPNVLCLVRPPGHHAGPDRAMGFCLFNNVAIAARYVQQKHQQKNVLIVDWDVHHGNGTQEVFYRDPTVFYFSLHRRPFYPGTGSSSETGEGPGRGTTLNRPLGMKTDRGTYLKTFASGLAQAVSGFRPDFVLISAGFDSAGDDPIGGLALRPEDFGTLTESVMAVADEHCRGRLVSVLEGGYNLSTLGPAVEQHLLGLMRARG